MSTLKVWKKPARERQQLWFRLRKYVIALGIFGISVMAIRAMLPGYEPDILNPPVARIVPPPGYDARTGTLANVPRPAPTPPGAGREASRNVDRTPVATIPKHTNRAPAGSGFRPLARSRTYGGFREIKPWAGGGD